MSDDDKVSLSSQFAIAATRATTVVGEELRGAMDDVRAAAPEYAKEAAEIVKKAGHYIADGLAGKIDTEAAREAALREHEALEFLVRKIAEERGQAAMKRLKKVLDVAVEVGLVMAKVAVAALI